MKALIYPVMWLINQLIERVCLPLKIEGKLYRINEILNDFRHKRK
jgi:hypothetical protein